MMRRRLAYFSAAGWPFAITVSTTVYNIDVRARAVAAGWDQVTPLAAEIIVTGAGCIGSTSAATPSLLIAGSFPTGSRARSTVAAGGRIIGMGGYGGGGAEPGIAASGGAGGTAIRTVLPLTVDNLGTIAGGGGGGGGGGTTYSSNTRAGGGGGGSGAGVNAGAVGSGGAPTGGYTNFPGYNGYPGNATTGGSGGQQFVVGDGAVGQPGGKGGDLGLNGGNGSNGSNVFGGFGGLAGAYIDGASLTTWGNTGTRLGRSIN